MLLKNADEEAAAKKAAEEAAALKAAEEAAAAAEAARLLEEQLLQLQLSNKLKFKLS